MNMTLRISFGKYKGKQVEEIPSHYLTWLLEQDWMYGEKHKELLEAIEYEMAVRDRSDAHFYD